MPVDTLEIANTNGPYSAEDVLLKGSKSNNWVSFCMLFFMALNSILLIVLIALLAAVGGAAHMAHDTVSEAMAHHNLTASDVFGTTYTAMSTMAQFNVPAMQSDLHSISETAANLNAQINLVNLTSFQSHVGAIAAVAGSIESLKGFNIPKFLNNLGTLNIPWYASTLRSFASSWKTSLVGGLYYGYDVTNWNGLASVLDAVDVFTGPTTFGAPTWDMSGTTTNDADIFLKSFMFDVADVHALGVTCSVRPILLTPLRALSHQRVPCVPSSFGRAFTRSCNPSRGNLSQSTTTARLVSTCPRAVRARK